MLQVTPPPITMGSNTLEDLPLEALDKIYDPIGTERDIESKHWVRLDSLNKKIHEALSLGYHGYLDFFGDREDPRNKVKKTAPLIVAFIMI
ncbi:MAG: hypothetical protein FRX49_08608 [Trebouxia sp. A1-2]|nr:MAG: hypothetical protein FRX49_08608 [Trebouxia sp. A1-2]